MRDASGEAAYGFHLLGLAKLMFGLLLGRDVASDGRRSHHTSILVDDRRDGKGDVQLLLILGDRNGLEVTHSFAVADLFHYLVNFFLAIGWCNGRYWAPEHFLVRVSVHLR